MHNIRGHTVNIPAPMVDRLWSSYFARYRQVEQSLSFPSQTKQDLKYIHTTGAFQLPISRLSTQRKTTIGQVLLDKEYSIHLKTKILLRGRNYFPGLMNGTNTSKLNNIAQLLTELVPLVYADDINSSDRVLYLALLDYIKELSADFPAHIQSNRAC